MNTIYSIMEHYKRVTKYWRDSLVDKQFSQGKYKFSNLAKSFLLNDKNNFFRVNNKNVLCNLFSGEDSTVETFYIPFSHKKITSHNKHEKDYRPEILFPIIFKVQVSENGFIYPIEKPIIPRDLLLPLDKEDFFIGNMDDYDLFVTQNDIPKFEFSETSEWEKYYSENIESQYQKGLIEYLLKESIIDNERAQEDCKKLIKSLNRNKTVKKKFLCAQGKYNEDWSKTIEDKLTDDGIFYKHIE